MRCDICEWVTSFSLRLRDLVLVETGCHVLSTSGQPPVRTWGASVNLEVVSWSLPAAMWRNLGVEFWDLPWALRVSRKQLGPKEPSDKCTSRCWLVAVLWEPLGQGRPAKLCPDNRATESARLKQSFLF